MTMKYDGEGDTLDILVKEGGRYIMPWRKVR